MIEMADFTGGETSVKDLTGLQVAVLQASSRNIAAAGTDSSSAVIYLPSTATLSQREALVGWLKSSEPRLQRAQLHTRVLPMHFTKSGSGYSFSAGTLLSVKTSPRESCGTGACGEALWYTPRTTTSVFAVAVDQSSKINEPLLQLKWDDAGKRSVFLGRFGETKNIFISLAELCGPAERAF
jgi:hypothetical protein